MSGQASSRMPSVRSLRTKSTRGKVYHNRRSVSVSIVLVTPQIS